MGVNVLFVPTYIICKFSEYAARVVRDVIDSVSDNVFGWWFSQKQVELPLIKDKIILMQAHVLAQKIRRRELKSVDVVKAYIQRIKDVQPIINAVVDYRFDEAIEEARIIDMIIEEATESDDELADEKPLLGVPVTIKEAIAVKGSLFTVGLAARRGVRATEDAEVTKLLKRAGAIPIAVTNTPELCYWWETYNTLYGRSKNPYNTTRTSGGSSGGEGSMLGAAGSVIGLGNDIGGSIRIPACFNGIFGHKPTRGIVSNEGQYPPAEPEMQSFLMTGPMCRYASDLIPMMKVLVPNHSNILSLDEEVDFRKVKIFYMENDGGNPLISSVDPEITKAQRKLLKHFEDSYQVKPVKVSISSLKHSFEIWSKIITTSAMKPITYEMTGRDGNVNLYHEYLKWVCCSSDHILPVLCSATLRYLWAPKDEEEVEKYIRMSYDMDTEFEKILGSDGIFIYPTGPDCAPYHGQPMFKPFNVAYTAAFNLIGLPVTQCPLGLSSKGLPIGLQVVSKRYNDHLTLAVANELEKTFGGWTAPCQLDC